MCIIIDTNVLACVLKKDSADHHDFKPVREWIFEGKGRIVFGGTKYLEEIKDNYLKLFLELKKAGKAVMVDKTLVDNEEKVVEKMIINNDFDDPHLVSLLRISKCKLICSRDKRAFPYFRHTTFFSPAANRPRIYSSKSNENLLCDRHIADICKPCTQTTNLQKAIIEKL
jgi:hypothetical protein